MRSTRTLSVLAAGGLLAGAVAMPTSAPAQGAAPTPCVGLSATDPAGDQKVGFAGNFTPAPADARVDLTGLFFRSENGKVTMNYQLAQASKAPVPGTAGNGIRVLFDSPADKFIDIRITATGVTYRYGHFGDTGPVSDGDLKGEVFEGPNGVISVELVPDVGGKPGARLSGSTFSWYSTGALLASTDYIPDEPAAWKYNGASCASGTTTQPSPAPPAAPQPQPQPGSPQTKPLGDLKMTVSPATLKARKLKKGKAIAFKLSTDEKLTNVTAAFKKGAKTFGTGRLATLDKTGTVKVKPRSKPKKGVYQLVVNGKRSDGTNGAASLKVRVK